MTKEKSIKDSIQGYIFLDEEYWHVINRPEFQRLKWIEQTSYRVLYPSARHDRFIHSIGTFHLGKMAFEGFHHNALKYIKKNCKKDYSDIEKSLLGDKRNFLLACLLHDIGHAPFSHTCEDLFNYKEKRTDIDSQINKNLLKAIDNCNIRFFSEDEKINFKKDYKTILRARKEDNFKAPSEHEIVSATIILNSSELFFSFILEDINADLIIRAVLGCVYPITGTMSERNRYIYGLKNCLIRLLNSNTIDVDKLDYMARDVAMSGYENTPIDNERLLKSLTVIIEGKNKILYPAFKKSALSVINNVVMAKNAQSKWLVNHPAVVYEAYLIRQAIGKVAREEVNEDKKCDDFIASVFSLEALGKNNVRVGKSLCYNYLSDSDLITLFKQYADEKEIEEFCNREARYKPIWKSMEEFAFLFKEKDKIRMVVDFFQPLTLYINGIEELGKPKYINDDLYTKVNESELKGKDSVIACLEILKNYPEDNNEFEYVLLEMNNNFSTKFNYKAIYISFGDDLDEYITFDKLKMAMEDDIVEKVKEIDKAFYLYSKGRLDRKKFVNYLIESIEASLPVMM